MKKNVTLTINYETYELARKKIKNMSALFEILLLDMFLNDKILYQDCYNINKLIDSKLKRLERKEKLIEYKNNNQEEYFKYIAEQVKIVNTKIFDK